MSEIYAVLECSGSALHEQSGEVLSDLLDVARRQPAATTVSVLLLLAQRAKLPDLTPLSQLGISTIYVLEHPDLAGYATQRYVDAVAYMIQQRAPLLVAAGATPNGRDWMPRLAAQLRLPLVPSCLTFDLHDDSIFALRSIYEGKAFAQTRTALHGRTGLVTLVPGVRGAASVPREKMHSPPALDIRVVRPELREEPARGRVRQIALQAPSPDEVELDVAERIVAGGRGVGQQGFSTIASFAHLLGAAVGATRVATDLGWIEHDRQIGATGKIVRPKLYIACGISGAVQHTSGMSEAQTVVAINPDRSAPILALADLGLLGDANQVLPLAAKLLEQSPLSSEQPEVEKGSYGHAAI